MIISTGNWVSESSSSAVFLVISQNSNSVELLFCETPLTWILGVIFFKSSLSIRKFLHNCEDHFDFYSLSAVHIIYD